MAKIRTIVVSDLHLGAANSILTHMKGGAPDTSQPAPALQAVAQCLRTLARSGEPPPQLVINGDLLELALGPLDDAAMVLDWWIHELSAPAGVWPFQPEILFLAGNHDHHLWESAREHRQLRELRAPIMRAPPTTPPLPGPRHASRLLVDVHDRTEDPTLTALFRRHDEKIRVLCHYPNLGLLSPDGARLLVLHHGHYIESIYRLISSLRQAIFPEQDEPATVEELEAENFAWVDFLWSALGRGALMGRDLELVYERIQDPAATGRIVQLLADEFLTRDPGKRLLRDAEHAAAGRVIRAMVARMTKRELGISGSLLGADARAGLFSYVSGPLRTQLQTELPGELPEITLCIGHTHKPFEMSVHFDGFAGRMPVFNTGGYVVDTLSPDLVHGASLLLVDDAFNIAALRLYNETQSGSPLAARVMVPDASQPNAFAAWLSSHVDFRTEPWSGLTREMDRAVRTTRGLLAQQVAISRQRVAQAQPATPRAKPAGRKTAPSAVPLRLPHISLPLDRMRDHYQAVIVGSGYGASIAAARLARAGVRVCVLERGREFQPGEYPRTLVEAMGEMQIEGAPEPVGARTALYDFHIGPDIGVFKGCGLGGTSLVNAGVALRAEPRVWQDSRWPKELRDDAGGLLQDCYARAENMLRPTPYPTDAPPLPKLQALEQSARAMGEPFYRPPINVTFKDGPNAAGVEQRACNGCGDCVTGCNYGAKNTLIMNYLPDAVRHGAEIFTEIEVRRVERTDDRWVVHYQPRAVGREEFNAPDLFLTADLVVLGAGALGSTEILLRSRAQGLPLSDALGQRFTGNGDVLGFAYDANETINGIGWGATPPGRYPVVGPTITGIIDARNKPKLADGMVIEEGAIPGAMSTLLPAMFAAFTTAVGQETDPEKVPPQQVLKDELGSFVTGAHNGALSRTQTFLIMSHDDDAGVLSLQNDRLQIRWPGAGSQAVFQRTSQAMDDATRAIGGVYVKDPIWSERLGRKVITVHPLGGCVMADRAQNGVVDHKGRVFSGKRGNAIHPGLYVCDGSVIPVTLGVNPLLTISALAERCVTLLARDHGWRTDESADVGPMPSATPLTTGIEFTETMAGTWWRAADPAGARNGAPFRFTLTIQADDLDALLDDPGHRAHITGTVVAQGLSRDPLVVTGGEFQLFIQDPANPQTLHMRYRMPLRSESGQVWFFDGIKTMRQASPLRLWHDTTTLDGTISEGAEAGGKVVAGCVLQIRALDFLRQLATVRVLNTDDRSERIRATLRFGRFFAGALYDTYVRPFVPI